MKLKSMVPYYKEIKHVLVICSLQFNVFIKSGLEWENETRKISF